MSGATPVHINAYGTDRLIMPFESDSVVETLQENVTRIIEAGAMASINHPNYKWAFGPAELLEVHGYRFLEVFNGHPTSNSFGAGGSLSAEAIWDRLLSAGREVWGIAVDDAHHFTGEFAAGRSNPGRGWVQARTGRLDRASILDAMDRGDFYSSTGVTLGDVSISKTGVRLEIEPDSAPSPARFTTVFHGEGGRVLDQVDGLSPAYTPRPQDVYVRATVQSSTGALAWTQPVFLHGVA